MESLIKDILRKKELRNLDEKTVLEQLEIYFTNNPEIKNTLDEKNYNKRSSKYKQTVKEVRKKLREIYGVFIQKDYQKKEKLLKQLTEKNQEEIIRKILLLHQSTKERLPFYKVIYNKLFEMIGPQENIMDLACGLNPLSCIWMSQQPKKYFASDISSKDMEFIQEFFDKTNINGKAVAIDLVKEQDKLEKIKADVCFLFKTLDSLETRQRNISKELIEKINVKWIVVSFSKVSIGGRKSIDKNKRNWIINYLKAKNCYYNEFEVENEYFIVIKKFLD